MFTKYMTIDIHVMVYIFTVCAVTDSVQRKSAMDCNYSVYFSDLLPSKYCSVIIFHFFFCQN